MGNNAPSTATPSGPPPIQLPERKTPEQANREQGITRHKDHYRVGRFSDDACGNVEARRAAETDELVEAETWYDPLTGCNIVLNKEIEEDLRISLFYNGVWIPHTYTNGDPVFLARPRYDTSLVEGYMPKQYFQIGVDSNETPFGFSADLQDDGFRQLGFVYGDVRVDYMSLPSQLGTVIDSYRFGYTFDDALYVGVDNYNNGILTGKYNNHTLGAVGSGDGYAIRYEYRLNF